jgi:hypothetical protein
MPWGLERHQDSGDLHFGNVNNDQKDRVVHLECVVTGMRNAEFLGDESAIFGISWSRTAL